MVQEKESHANTHTRWEERRNVSSRYLILCSISSDIFIHSAEESAVSSSAFHENEGRARLEIRPIYNFLWKFCILVTCVFLKHTCVYFSLQLYNLFSFILIHSL